MINRAGNKEKAKRVLNENGNLSGMVGMEILYRVIGVEEGLSGSVNIGGIAFVASACTVFTIIQKYDSLWSINSWRTAFRQLAVEVSVTG